MEEIKILLVDDHQIVRDGLKVLLENLGGITIIGEADSGADLFRKLEVLQPDIVITDISMPDISGIEVARMISENQKWNKIKVMMLSMYNDDDFVLNSIEAGAKAYLPKNTSRQELYNAIQAVYRGDVYFEKSVSEIIVRNYVKNVRNNDSSARKETSLSSREKEILRLIASSLSNQEIAEKLSISVRTVESHKTHIMQKLELRNSVDLIKYAIKENLTDL